MPKPTPVVFIVDWNACIKCGACVAVCPQKVGFISPFDTIAVDRPCDIVCIDCEKVCPVTAITNRRATTAEIAAMGCDNDTRNIREPRAATELKCQVSHFIGCSFLSLVTRWLLWTNILIAGSAAGWVIVTVHTLALPVDWALIVLAFSLALAFYTRDRLDERERHTDLLTMPERTIWVQRHAVALKRVVWGSFLGTVVLSAMRPAALPPILAGLGFALSYTVRWLPWRGRRLGWKHLPGLKMPFVAILWVLITVITPAAVYGQVWRANTWLLAAAVYALIMVQILLNDLRDVAGDRLSGTVSLPALVGEPAARCIGYALTLVAALLTLFLAPTPFLPAALYSAFLIWRYRREYDTRWRGWIEAQGLIAALVSLPGLFS